MDLTEAAVDVTYWKCERTTGLKSGPHWPSDSEYSNLHFRFLLESGIHRSTRANSILAELTSEEAT